MSLRTYQPNEPVTFLGSILAVVGGGLLAGVMSGFQMSALATLPGAPLLLPLSIVAACIFMKSAYVYPVAFGAGIVGDALFGSLFGSHVLALIGVVMLVRVIQFRLGMSAPLQEAFLAVVGTLSFQIFYMAAVAAVTLGEVFPLSFSSLHVTSLPADLVIGFALGSLQFAYRRRGYRGRQRYA